MEGGKSERRGGEGGKSERRGGKGGKSERRGGEVVTHGRFIFNERTGLPTTVMVITSASQSDHTATHLYLQSTSLIPKPQVTENEAM